MSGEQAAFEAYPELLRFANLHDFGGWNFEHNDVASAGTVYTKGVRVWPDLTIEARALRGQTDALALRSNPDSKTVWIRDGNLASVRDRLLGSILLFGLRSQL